MYTFLLRSLALLMALGLFGQIARAQEALPMPTDQRIREAWSYLLPEEQSEVSEWFRSEVEYLETSQNKLIDYLIDGEPLDRGQWPEAQPMPWFDPKTHAPAQPIKRTRLDPASSLVKKVTKDLKGSMPTDFLLRAWDYDWTTGGLVKVGDERDPQLLFENGLMGLPPRIDLAEALLLRRLDDGSQRVALTAYLHIYTDRNGNAYPGISLYDAWASGREFEMPDIDTLGILHDVYDDWKSFKAPVPGGKQKKLYEKIGVAFLEAKHHRELLEAVVVNYMRGNAIPTNTYTPNSLALNALWEGFDNSPEAFRKDLPSPKKWEKYLKDLVKKTKKKSFREQGQGRLTWFEGDRWRVKSTLVWVLREFGAMDRTELPEPKPAPEQKPAKALLPESYKRTFRD
jgi:hypothetical protein